jgi:hypothetical protein
MSGWLPPGVTDKDIDDAAPHDELQQCDVCKRYFMPEALRSVKYDFDLCLQCRVDLLQKQDDEEGID